MLYIGGITLAYLGVIIIEKVIYKLNSKMGAILYEKINFMDNDYYKNTTIGEINTILQNDLKYMTRLLTYTVKQFTGEVLTAIFSIIYCIKINIPLTMTFLFFTPIYLLLIFRYNKKSKILYETQRLKLSNLNQYIQENIKGNKLIKNLGTEEKEIETFKQINTDYIDYKIKINCKMFNYMELMKVLSQFIWIVLIAVGGFFIMKGQVTVGEFLIFNSLINGIASPIYNLVDYINDWRHFKVSVGKMKILIDANPKQKDNGKDILQHINNIKFNNVNFEIDEKTVLKNINLELVENKTYAFIGEIGSGKTTIANLICRYYEIDNGEIKIDEISIKDIKLKSLRSQIIIMQQANFLFSKSIIDNLMYGNENITKEQVIEICKKINIHSWIMKFPKGYDTLLKENGSNLSDGEKQILCYARTIINNPKILILDEATSKMDTKTEKVLQNLTNEMIKDKTLVIIAHRLSTIVDCDKIFFVKDKKITEMGTHEELMKIKGDYYNLYISQII